MTATGLLTWTNPVFSGNPTVVIIDVTDQDNNVSGTPRPSPCRSSPSPALAAPPARRISAVEHLGRWCRRNPRVAVLAASVLLLLVTVATTSTVVAQDHMTNSITLPDRTTRDGTDYEPTPSCVPRVEPSHSARKQTRPEGRDRLLPSQSTGRTSRDRHLSRSRRSNTYDAEWVRSAFDQITSGSWDTRSSQVNRGTFRS